MLRARKYTVILMLFTITMGILAGLAVPPAMAKQETLDGKTVELTWGEEIGIVLSSDIPGCESLDIPQAIDEGKYEEIFSFVKELSRTAENSSKLEIDPIPVPLYDKIAFYVVSVESVDFNHDVDGETLNVSDDVCTVALQCRYSTDTEEDPFPLEMKTITPAIDSDIEDRTISRIEWTISEDVYLGTISYDYEDIPGVDAGLPSQEIYRFDLDLKSSVLDTISCDYGISAILSEDIDDHINDRYDALLTVSRDTGEESSCWSYSGDAISETEYLFEDEKRVGRSDSLTLNLEEINGKSDPIDLLFSISRAEREDELTGNHLTWIFQIADISEDEENSKDIFKVQFQANYGLNLNRETLKAHAWETASIDLAMDGSYLPEELPLAENLPSSLLFTNRGDAWGNIDIDENTGIISGTVRADYDDRLVDGDHPEVPLARRKMEAHADFSNSEETENTFRGTLTFDCVDNLFNRIAVDASLAADFNVTIPDNEPGKVLSSIFRETAGELGRNIGDGELSDNFTIEVDAQAALAVYQLAEADHRVHFEPGYLCVTGYPVFGYLIDIEGDSTGTDEGHLIARFREDHSLIPEEHDQESLGIENYDSLSGDIIFHTDDAQVNTVTFFQDGDGKLGERSTIAAPGKDFTVKRWDVQFEEGTIKSSDLACIMYSPRVELSEEDLRTKFSSSEAFESFRKRLDEAAASADKIVEAVAAEPAISIYKIFEDENEIVDLIALVETAIDDGIIPGYSSVFCDASWIGGRLSIQFRVLFVDGSNRAVKVMQNDNEEEPIYYIAISDGRHDGKIVDPMGIVTRSEAAAVATPTPYGSSSSSGGCSVGTFTPTALLLLAPLMLIRRP